ncbi:MAG: FAD/NAD(P)-binding protein [Blastocatellia bacterium]|nr:FAD/NAD(P)-binding protein [Blastocatellia bacterium]
MAPELEAGIDTMMKVADPMLPQPFRIRRVKRETADTFTMDLDPPGEARAFSFAPGQFNMLYVFGVGEVPVSISGDPDKTETLVHTTRAVGAVTEAMQGLQSGDSIGVRGPFGRGWPVEEARGKDIVLVAGGIGLAPLRPALYRVLARRDEYGKVVLLYGARTPADILYRRELESWRARFDLEVYVTVDRALAERNRSSWRGNVGVVTSLIQRVAFDPLEVMAILCGPEVMMRFTIMELEKRGVSGSDIYLSMERNMKCAIGFCGHCQYGPSFICKDGPVFSYHEISDLFAKREV